MKNASSIQMQGAAATVQAEVVAVLEAQRLRQARLMLALSGGIDSMVLLDVLAKLVPAPQLSAVHVHHGLSSHADQWLQASAQRCAELSVPLRAVRVKVEAASGESLEAGARAVRYAAFRSQDAEVVVLAHNADDQAETVLLQLLRGAGARGLAAMPTLRVLDSTTGLRLLRPLLAVARSAITAYAQAHRLCWVEDESNADLGFDRNFLRQRVFPLLDQRFPGYRETFMRASRNLGDAAFLCEELARSDAAEATQNGRLRVAALRALHPARGANLLRHWLQQQGFAMPRREQVEQALQQILGARSDARLQVRAGNVMLRRYRQLLYAETPIAPPDHWQLEWRGTAELMLPGNLGALRFTPAQGVGLSRASLFREPALVRPRSGGERLKLASNRPSRTLKNLLQEAEVPDWRRAALPLLFVGRQLVWIPGIGMDCRFLAQAEEEGVLISWSALQAC